MFQRVEYRLLIYYQKGFSVSPFLLHLVYLSNKGIPLFCKDVERFYIINRTVDRSDECMYSLFQI